jgi:hypothetical protein
MNMVSHQKSALTAGKVPGNLFMLQVQFRVTSNDINGATMPCGTTPV